jgi:NADPH-dependent curcumin reductase
VYGTFGVQRYALSDGRGVTRIDTTLAPAPVQLGALGLSGLTVEEPGFDAAIDYKADDLRGQLKANAPDGVFFDNVGGEALEAALARLARGARIVLSGAISLRYAELSRFRRVACAGSAGHRGSGCNRRAGHRGGQ